jgi:hypothetical protein
VSVADVRRPPSDASTATFRSTTWRQAGLAAAVRSSLTSLGDTPKCCQSRPAILANLRCISTVRKPLGRALGSEKGIILAEFIGECLDGTQGCQGEVSEYLALEWVGLAYPRASGSKSSTSSGCSRGSTGQARTPLTGTAPRLCGLPNPHLRRRSREDNAHGLPVGQQP